MNMFRTNFLISKHDDETRLLVKEQSGFPIHQSLSILSGERFENRFNLEWPLPLKQDHNANPFALPIFILGSATVNGTLCLCQGLTTVLWNPATAEFKILPPSFQPAENIDFNFPSHGFGYDRVTDNYKVIRKVWYPSVFEGCDWVYLPDKDDPFWERDVHGLDKNDGFWEENELVVKLYQPFWEIYSLKSDSWRKLHGFDDMPVPYPGITPTVNLNGFCHWLTQDLIMI